jgi:hypothetical protein
VKAAVRVKADVLAAADNNARWCDAVCRSHGLASRFVHDLWIAPLESPRFYPDLVTLRAIAAVADVFTHLPAAADHIKDSFACLDLAPEGFDVLFDAHWIVSPLTASGGTRAHLYASRQRRRGRRLDKRRGAGGHHPR